MITQKIGSLMKKPQYFIYTINTEATTVGAVQGSVPIILVGVDATLHIDWGDGSSEVRTTSPSWAGITHTYSSPGIYQIVVAIDKPENIYVSANRRGNYYDATYGTPAKIMRDTLVSVDAPFPAFAGIIDKNDPYPTTSNCFPNSFRRLFYEHKSLVSLPSNVFENTPYITDLSGFFEGCSAFSTIPVGFFDGLPNLSTVNTCFAKTSIVSIPNDLLVNCASNINVSSLFYRCTSLASIPIDLLKNQTAITSLYAFLIDTSSLGTFSLNIYSPLITNVIAFCPQQNPSPNTRTIHVIPGSTTEATFNANASSYYLTIVPDIVV